MNNEMTLPGMVDIKGETFAVTVGEHNIYVEGLRTGRCIWECPNNDAGRALTARILRNEGAVVRDRECA